VQALSRTGEAEFLGHGEEVAKLTEVEHIYGYRISDGLNIYLFL
jgi:hypothetical protein